MRACSRPQTQPLGELLRLRAARRSCQGHRCKRPVLRRRQATLCMNVTRCRARRLSFRSPPATLVRSAGQLVRCRAHRAVAVMRRACYVLRAASGTAPRARRRRRAHGRARLEGEHPHCGDVAAWTHYPMAVAIASGLAQGALGQRPLRRCLVQGRAARPAGAGRPERGRQDDPAADAGRRGVARGRRARVRQGTRIALHDQRPPAAAQASCCASYALAGTADLVAAVEAQLRTLEESMASGTHDPATMRRYAAAQAQLEHAGGYDWRDARGVVRARPRLPRRRPRTGRSRRSREAS